jgi:hypothetical protein
VDLYIHSPIRLHGVELDVLSTGTSPLLMTHLVEHVPVGNERELRYRRQDVSHLTTNDFFFGDDVKEIVYYTNAASAVYCRL